MLPREKFLHLLDALQADEDVNAAHRRPYLYKSKPSLDVPRNLHEEFHKQFDE